MSRALFDELVATGWPRVEQLVADAEEESVQLDFKDVAPTAVPSREAFIKEKLARALSGFANTDGGTLIYGINTNKSPKGTPDRAQGVVPIDDAAAFRADLERLASKLVEPVIAAVDIREIVKPSAGAAGVVVVHVPQSYGGPHRATGTGVKGVDEHYYLRTTTECSVMPHTLLAALFSRSAPPRLELRARFHLVPGGEKRVEMRLVNRGRGTARRPVVSMVENEVEWGSTPHVGNPYRRIESTLEDGRPISVFEPREPTDFALYPGTEVPVSTGRISERALSGNVIRVTFEASLYALDAQPVSGHAILETNDGESEADCLAHRAVIGGLP